ncbi:MAG: potassium-transporting ATPase subunit KdpA, partial [Ignavibacteria bacterium]|nr:potassium-transporting ATPase subunit KdpA [Ignavibacteria bacterium]
MDNIIAMEPTQAFNTVALRPIQIFSFIPVKQARHILHSLSCFLFTIRNQWNKRKLLEHLVFKALSNRSGNNLGNFYNLMLKSCTRILLPLAVIVALILIFNGTPVTFQGAEQVITLQGDTVSVA